MSGFKLCELPESSFKVLRDIADTWLVWPIHVQDSDDEIVLRTDSGMGEDSMDYIDDTVLILISEFEDNLLISRVARREYRLNGPVHLKELNHDVIFMCFETLGIAVND